MVRDLGYSGRHQATSQTDCQLPKGWWCQSITVAHEKARDLRVLGQTADAGFELGAQKTFPLNQAQLWDFMVSAGGLHMWLGKTADFRLNEKALYTTAEGVRGEVRTIDPGKRLRMTWQPVKWKDPSTLQLYFLPTATDTALRFHHEKLADETTRAQMLMHWKTVLKTLQERQAD